MYEGAVISISVALISVAHATDENENLSKSSTFYGALIQSVKCVYLLASFTNRLVYPKQGM